MHNRPVNLRESRQAYDWHQSDDNRRTDRRDTRHEDPNATYTYGRFENYIRRRRSTSSRYMTLKDARMMIPNFDGASPQKFKKFLSTCSYAIQHIDPADEEFLIQAILCTKLDGKAMQDFETHDIQTYEELKQQLGFCYQSKRSTTNIQIEFNSIETKTEGKRIRFRPTR